MKSLLRPVSLKYIVGCFSFVMLGMGTVEANACQMYWSFQSAQKSDLQLIQSASKGIDEKEILVAQSIADEYLNVSGAEIAFVGSGQLKSPLNIVGGLDSNVLFLDEGLWLVKLKGSQIADAMEKSVAFYPSSNSSFLHLAGIQVTFSTSRQTPSRITSIKVNQVSLAAEREYTVAMSETLAHGALGFNSIWSFKSPEKEVLPSLANLLKGKNVQTSSFRWFPQP